MAVRRKASSTQTAATAAGAPGGTAKVSRKRTGSETAPRSMKGRREPAAASILSERAPMTGSITTSHTLATVTTAPATIAATPRVSVR